MRIIAKKRTRWEDISVLEHDHRVPLQLYLLASAAAVTSAVIEELPASTGVWMASPVRAATLSLFLNCSVSAWR